MPIGDRPLLAGLQPEPGRVISEIAQPLVFTNMEAGAAVGNTVQKG